MKEDFINCLNELSDAVIRSSKIASPESPSVGLDVRGLLLLSYGEQRRELGGIYAAFFGRGDFFRALVENNCIDLEFTERFNPLYYEFMAFEERD